jgi:hypothetical protein
MEETLMTSLAALAAGASIYMGSPMADRDQGQPPQGTTLPDGMQEMGSMQFSVFAFFLLLFLTLAFSTLANK